MLAGTASRAVWWATVSRVEELPWPVEKANRVRAQRWLNLATEVNMAQKEPYETPEIREEAVTPGGLACHGSPFDNHF